MQIEGEAEGKSTAAHIVDGERLGEAGGRRRREVGRQEEARAPWLEVEVAGAGIGRGTEK